MLPDIENLAYLDFSADRIRVLYNYNLLFLDLKFSRIEDVSDCRVNAK
jgi:hypothetical protein